ncbi:MAG TPA: hypothetical protein VF449_06720 [Parvibaculum sp.]
MTLVSGMLHGRTAAGAKNADGQAVAMPSAAGADRPAKRVVAQGKAGEELRNALGLLLETGGGTSAANLQVLGLQALREKVGDQWPKYKSVIHTVVESVLSRSLAASDHYARLSDELYIIAFGDLDAAAAAKRADAIGDAIVKQLLGTEAGASISVRMTGGKLGVDAKGDIVFTEQSPHRARAVHGARHPGASGAGRPGGDVGWQSRAKAALAETSEDELDELLREAAGVHEVRQSAKKRPEPDDASDLDDALREAADAFRESTSLDYSIGFTPIWDAKKQAITSYAVMPNYRGRARWRFGHDVLGDLPTANDILDLNRACLRIAIKETAKAYRNNSAVLIISQVHYRSITSKEAVAALQSECARIPEFLRKYLAIQIVGIPNDLSISAMTAAISMLHRYVRLVSGRVGLGVSAARLKLLGFDTICFAHEDPEFTLADRAKVQKRMADAALHGLAIVVEFVTSRAAAVELVELGISHVSGFFVGLPLERPLGLQWKTLDELPIEDSQGRDGNAAAR